MAIYALYGFMSDDIDSARKLLESALGMQFDRRDSDFQGGEYFQWGKTDGEHFVLKRNIDPIDGEPAEMAFPAHRILFYVNDSERAAEWQERLPQGANDFALLRHEDLA